MKFRESSKNEDYINEEQRGKARCPLGKKAGRDKKSKRLRGSKERDWTRGRILSSLFSSSSIIIIIIFFPWHLIFASSGEIQGREDRTSDLSTVPTLNAPSPIN